MDKTSPQGVYDALVKEDDEHDPSEFWLSKISWALYEQTLPDEIIKNYMQVGYDTAYNPYISGRDHCMQFRGKPVFKKHE